MMTDNALSSRRAARIRSLQAVILEAPGDLAPESRRQALERACAWARGVTADEYPLAKPLAGFVDTVARHAYKVSDGDIERLQGAGYSEDAIFEAVVATAVGAGLSRLDIGLAALRVRG